MKLGQKYYMGDGENYFKYREDKYNSSTIRAELFNNKDQIIDKQLVKGGMTNEDLSHHQVTEYFEARLLNL